MIVKFDAYLPDLLQDRSLEISGVSWIAANGSGDGSAAMHRQPNRAVMAFANNP
jgi:hypothetical protein